MHAAKKWEGLPDRYVMDTPIYYDTPKNKSLKSKLEGDHSLAILARHTAAAYSMVEMVAGT